MHAVETMWVAEGELGGGCSWATAAGPGRRGYAVLVGRASRVWLFYCRSSRLIGAGAAAVRPASRRLSRAIRAFAGSGPRCPLLAVCGPEQLALIDSIAERVQTLGGVAVGDPRHAAEITCVLRPPDGAEEVPAMLSRPLEAHETILTHAHENASRATGFGDDGTGDLLVSAVIRSGELQAWFLAEHLVDTPRVHADGMANYRKVAYKLQKRRI